MLLRFLILFCFIFSLVSCSSLKGKSKAQATFDPNDFAVSSSQELTPNPQKRLAGAATRLDLVYPKQLHKQWIKHFTGRGKKIFETHMSNASEIKSTVQKILMEEGVPVELFYLGLIESGYNAKIKSVAQAAGHWQFMKATGKYYGLRIDQNVDERFSIYKSTKAAARYLIDLYNMFGTWELALCAYNSGPYRVSSAIKKAGTNDYRALVAQELLPKETLSYIPKLVAARDIFREPKRFGLSYMKKNPILFENALAKNVDKSVDLNKLSQRLKIPYGKLLALNPDIKKGKIENMTLYFPESVERIPDAKFKLALVEKNSRSIASVSTKKKIRYKIYVSKTQETVKDVARRYGVSFQNLSRLNGPKLHADRQLKVGERLRIPL